MSLPILNITRTGGGLGRRAPGSDHVSGLIMQAPAGYGGVTFDEDMIFTQLADAESAGITKAEDSSKTALVWHHINRFFQQAPGSKLYVRLVSDSVAMDTICDKTSTHLSDMIGKALGEIRQVGVVIHNQTATDATTGLQADVKDAVAKAQATAEEAWTKHWPIHVLLEGRAFSGTTTTVADLRAEEAGYVSVVLLQDIDVQKGDATYSGYAEVGLVLGLIARADVSQGIHEVKSFRIDDAATGTMLNPGLSSDDGLDEFTETELKNLDDKGYITCRYLNDRPGAAPGVFITRDATCTSVSDDTATIRNNRTIGKAVRLSYSVLIRELNSRIAVTPDGKVAPEVVKSWEELVKGELSEMVVDGDISDDPDCYIDPDQPILSTGELKVKIAIVPFGIAETISVTIGLQNPNQ